MKTYLRHAKLGREVERWFTHRKKLNRPGDLKFLLFTEATRVLSRLHGRRMPNPQDVSKGGIALVARWLAEKKRFGTPALLDTNPSTGVRVCLEAKLERLDISGSFFRFSAEPYTHAKAQAVADAGCNAASHYSAAEVGHIGLACGCPHAPDEVHIMADKVAVIQRQRVVGRAGLPVGSLFITAVSPSCPKVMLNVELGDYGILEERRCGCLLDTLGFHTHLHEIRSFEKLNSEGMTFLGSHVIKVLEEVLPARFGGSPLDYQFTEWEEAGVPRVSLLVSPRLQHVNEREVINTVLEALSTQSPSGMMMTDVWRSLGTMRVERREPCSTEAMKLLPLHIRGLQRRS